MSTTDRNGAGLDPGEHPDPHASEFAAAGYRFGARHDEPEPFPLDDGQPEPAAPADLPPAPPLHWLVCRTCNGLGLVLDADLTRQLQENGHDRVVMAPCLPCRRTGGIVTPS